MKLSNQAIGAIMLALQKSLMEQSDIVPVLQEFNIEKSAEGLVVENPPVVEFQSPEIRTTETDLTVAEENA